MTALQDRKTSTLHEWPSVQIRRAVELIRDRGIARDRPYIGLEHVESGTGRLVEPIAGLASDSNAGEEPSAEGTTTLFKASDVLFGKLRPYLAKVHLAEWTGRCSAELLVLRPVRFVPSFLKYRLLSDDFIGLVTSSTFGAKMPRADWDFIGRVDVPLPPLSVQKHIAAFLDRKTAVIDALIAKKERLIELLQEKRQAAVAQAVTKGLDATVANKDSGVEWLGQIPAHWSKIPLGLISRIYNGSTPSREDRGYWTDGVVPWLTSAKVHEGRVVTADEFVTERAVRECHLPMVPAGSVLIAITGEGKTRGSAALLCNSATTSQHIAAITPTSRATSEYLWRYLSTLYRWLRFESSGGGSTKAAITCEFLRTVPVLLPPVDEQVAICKQLNSLTADADAVIGLSTRTVILLREYRQALISAAVTGKIDIPAEEAA